MFVIVKYGADEERIVNPNVLSSVLLNHIRKTCGFEGIQENIDLASESGEVVDLVSKGKEYAKKYLEPRTTYIPVKVIGDDSEENSQTYVPLLDNAASDKMKFFVSNTTFRARQGKKGGKDGDRSGKGESDGPVGTGGGGGGGITGKFGKNDGKGGGQDEKGDKKAGNGGGAGGGGNDSGDANKKNASSEKKVQGKTGAASKK